MSRRGKRILSYGSERSKFSALASLHLTLNRLEDRAGIARSCSLSEHDPGVYSARRAAFRKKRYSLLKGLVPAGGGMTL